LSAGVAAPELEIRLLGPLEAVRGGRQVPLGGPKQRLVLAVLALHAGSVVSADRLVETLWEDEPPPTASTALQGHVSRLRRLLGADAIVTRPPGYALDRPVETVDLHRFLALAEAAREQEQPVREATLERALGLWRGPVFADLEDGAGLTEEARRLEELRLVAYEDLVETRLALGRHAEVVVELEAFVRREPFRERAIEQLMLALYRGGRQTDALDAYRRYRQELSDALGLEPGPALRALERRILGQDPGLAPPVTAPIGDAAPRRLPLTVVALGIAVAGEADLEAYGRLVAQAREAARLALERHGASVRHAPGSGLLGLFGDPLPREDDGRRALRAAREAIGAVEAVAGESAQRLGVVLEARAGVASGETFAGESPALERALRLQAEAPAGDVRTDAATVALARGRELRLDRPLAGRGDERRRLVEAYEETVRDGRSRVVTLVGPAGIGKSRLADDLLSSLGPGTRVLRARCLSYGDGVSLVPAIDLVRAALRLPPGSSEGRALAKLRPLLAGDERAEAAEERLLGLLGLRQGASHDEIGWAVRRLLEGIARTRPVVVYVDDLHWAAPAFVDVVEQIAEPYAAPLLLVATARSLPSQRLAQGAVELGPLDELACAQLVAGLLEGEVDPATLALLVDAAAGNPFFLEELVLDLREAGQLALEGTRWRLVGSVRPPASVQALLAARIERLPADQRDVLARASVSGRGFVLAALAELVDGDVDVDAALAELETAELVRPAEDDDHDFDFRHILVREVAYAALPLALRADLHARHAAWLERERISAPREREALVVYHLDRAHRARVSLGVDDAGEARTLAARTAALGRVFLEEGDAAAAARLLARSRELGDDDPRILVGLGRAHFDAGDFTAADAAFAAAADGDAAVRAALGRLEIRLHTDPAVDLEAASVQIDEALAVLEQRGDDEGLAEAWFARAYVSLVRARAAELAGVLERAVEHARRTGRGRAEMWLLLLLCATTWYGPMPLPDAVDRCEELLAEADGRPALEAAALQSLGVLHAMGGEAVRARELVERSRAIRRELGQLVGAAGSAIDAGIVELLAGDFVGAERVLREGYAELERLGEVGHFSTVAAFLAEAVAGQGRFEEARALAASSAEATAEADVASQIGWRSTEARVLAAEGNHADAERVALEATRYAELTDFAVTSAQAWAALADVRLAAGDEAAATAARAKAAAMLERKGCAPSAVRAWVRA
jgi:DNA-binding SARP family transcriptional activator